MNEIRKYPIDYNYHNKNQLKGVIYEIFCFNYLIERNKDIKFFKIKNEEEYKNKQIVYCIRLKGT